MGREDKLERQQERIDRQQERLERKEERVQDRLQQERGDDHREERADRREERQQDRREDRQQERMERRDDRVDRQRDMEVAANPTFIPGRQTKIILSPGTGAGWITYAPRSATDNFLVWMLTYEPLIRAMERRESKDRLEELVKDFHRDARQKFGVERIVCARVGDLVVAEVGGPFEVRERDGAEWIVDVRNRRTVPMGAVVY